MRSRKCRELLEQGLSAQELLQTLVVLVLGEEFAFFVGIFEGKLVEETFIDDLVEVGGHPDGVAGYEDVGHDAASSIYRASQPGLIHQGVVLFDAVGVLSLIHI